MVGGGGWIQSEYDKYVMWDAGHHGAMETDISHD